MVPADIPDHRFTLKSSFAIYMSSAASRTASFFIAFFTGFLLRALSTALLTDFLTTLLDVFLRTVWSIALSSRLVATFLALLAFAIYQSFVRREFAMGHSHGMRLSIGLTCYGSVNSVIASVVSPLIPSRSPSHKSASTFHPTFATLQAGSLRRNLLVLRFPLRGGVNNFRGDLWFIKTKRRRVFDAGGASLESSALHGVVVDRSGRPQKRAGEARLSGSGRESPSDPDSEGVRFGAGNC